MELRSPALQADSLSSEPLGKPVGLDRFQEKSNKSKLGFFRVSHTKPVLSWLLRKMNPDKEGKGRSSLMAQW